MAKFKQGRYVFVEELGKGSFGNVFKVNDTLSNELRAIKRIEAGAPNSIDSSNDEMMVREARLLKKFKSNYIIEYIDYFREGFYHYIVTELANDGDLAKRITRYKEKDKKFSEDIVLFWTNQLLKGTQN